MCVCVCVCEGETGVVENFYLHVELFYVLTVYTYDCIIMETRS